MGTFAALIFPTTLSIISNTFRERRERAAALGIWGAVVGLGVATGPLTGGVLLEHFYWGSVFWALVPLALVTAVAAFLFVPESRDPSVPGLDRVGLVLSVAMLVSLTYTIIEAPSHGWSSPATLGGFAAAGALLGDLRAVGAAYAAPDARRDALQGPPLQRRERCGHDHVLRAVRVHLPGHPVLPVRARLRRPVDRRADPAGRAQHRGRVRRRCGAGTADRDQDRGDHGMVLFGTAFLWISTASVATSYAHVIVPQMVLMGLGMGLISTPATESILLVLPPARAGVGSAVNDATRELGGTLGVAVVGSIFSSVFGAHLASGSYAALPGDVLGRAQDSVGVAQAVAAQDPRLVTAFHDSFLAGMSTACTVVGLLCLVGAVAAAFLLPGRIVGPVEIADRAGARAGRRLSRSCA